MSHTCRRLSVVMAGVAMAMTAHPNSVSGISPGARLPRHHLLAGPGSVIVAAQARVGARQVADIRLSRGPTATTGGRIDDEVSIATSAQDESFGELRQVVAALTNGNYAVVWTEGSFPVTTTRMQLVSPEGQMLLGPDGIALVGRGGGDEGDPVVVANHDGGGFVALMLDSRVRVQRFDGRGSLLWPGKAGTQAMRDAESVYHATPHLTADGAGGVYVCASRGGTAEGIKCQHIDKSGRRMWRNAGLAAGGQAGWRILPRAVAGADGSLMVFWRNQGDPFDAVDQGMRIEGQRFTPGGTRAWGPDGLTVRETNLADSNHHGFQPFDVIPDGEGGAIVVFNDWLNFARPNLDVGAQRVRADGRLLWGAVAKVASSKRHHQLSAIVATLDGGVVALAEEYGNATSRNKLRAYRLGANGKPAWPRRGLVVSDPRNRGLNYNTQAFLDDGIASFAWTEQSTPATLEMDIKMARYRLDGTRLDDSTGIVLVRHGSLWRSVRAYNCRPRRSGNNCRASTRVA